MIRIVTSQEFIRTFDKLLQSDAKLLEQWDCPPEYTRLFMTREGGLLKRVAQELQVGYWPELLNIDACFYEGAREPFLVSVAIEHENIAHSSFREANKLALLSVPLKVLITYPPECRLDRAFLAEFHEIVGACAKSVGDSPPGEYLVILGCLEHGASCWRYYRWADREFIPLQVEHTE